MTHGDNSSVKCPACKLMIHKPLAGNDPQPGRIVEITANCYHCKTAIHFWARHTITVEAEKESKVR